MSVARWWAGVRMRDLNGAVAQLGERRVRIAKVEGSIPFRSTNSMARSSCCAIDGRKKEADAATLVPHNHVFCVGIDVVRGASLRICMCVRAHGRPQRTSDAVYQHEQRFRAQSVLSLEGTPDSLP
jgi:hypothetical protein